MTFALAAAGTGGHVYPALAVAAALEERGIESERIIFFGGDRMEAGAVPAAGYPFVQLDIRGLRRSLSAENLTLPLSLRRAARTVRETFDQMQTKVVAVFGGYVTGPTVMAARRRRTPIVVHEQNAVPGVANRLANRYSAKTLVAFAPAAGVLRGAAVVGNPIRSDLVTFERGRLRDEARRHFGISGRREVLGVLGGSQGALALNGAIAWLLEDESLEVDVVHLTGSAHIEEIAAVAQSDPRWRPFGYESRMDLFYAAADLVVSRAGAMTMSELAATSTPSVVIPLPAGKGYQARNADDLVSVGGSVVLAQDRIGQLPILLGRLLQDAEERNRMGKAAGSVGHPNAADLVAGEMMELVDVG